jgi:hypothetical protein
VAEQLHLHLKPARHGKEPLRLALNVSAINWRYVARRSRSIFGAIANHSADESLRDGFAQRQYADDAALLEVLRAQLCGPRLKRAARGTGRMPVKAAVLFAASRRGRRLHVLVDRMEKRLATREALALCG